jgi:hypothetical protein
MSSPAAVDWRPAARMIKAAKQDARPLGALLKESAAAFPRLGDPLKQTWSGLREEWYADGLVWVFKRQDVAAPILRLLGREPGSLARAEFSVEREVSMPEGRPDVIIYCGDSVKFGVEIKTTSAPDLDQLKRYVSVLGAGNVVLVAKEAPEDIEPGGWSFRSWRQVALGLRTWAARWSRDGRTLEAAMTLALCGAVEQHLLGLGSNGPRAQAYIEEWLRENRHGK